MEKYIIALMVLFIISVLLMMHKNYTSQNKEPFLDPYSCVLYKKAVNDQLRWNLIHQQGVYDNWMNVPQYMKE